MPSDPLYEMRLSRDNAVEFGRQMFARTKELEVRLSEAEAENARLRAELTSEEKSAKSWYEQAVNAGHALFKAEATLREAQDMANLIEEVANKKCAEAERKREEAEKAVAVLQASLQDWVRRHGIQAKKAEEAERALVEARGKHLDDELQIGGLMNMVKDRDALVRVVNEYRREMTSPMKDLILCRQRREEMFAVLERLASQQDTHPPEKKSQEKS